MNKPAPPNRLAAEASHRADGYWFASRGGVIANLAVSVTLALAPNRDFDTWQKASMGWLLAGASFVMERRWRARAVWLRDTERWWERLDEAPSIRPFPRVTATTGRWMRRMELWMLGSWFGRLLARAPREKGNS